ncbi:MAG: hypothetical protein GX216_02615 [Methanomicrobiales archaeon]|nr:hypothetical protein [Methanomicrobiales archaeon]
MPGFPGPGRVLLAWTGRTPGTGNVAIFNDIKNYHAIHDRVAAPRRWGVERTGSDPWRVRFGVYHIRQAGMFQAWIASYVSFHADTGMNDQRRCRRVSHPAGHPDRLPNDPETPAAW